MQIYEYFIVYISCTSKNKINKTKKQPNKNMLNKAKHKTRLTQKVKQNT